MFIIGRNTFKRMFYQMVVIAIIKILKFAETSSRSGVLIFRLILLFGRLLVCFIVNYFLVGPVIGRVACL